MNIFSPAKINLFLEILSKRNDGFHLINSLMCVCNIGDTINVEKSHKFDLQITGKFKDLLDGKQNIVEDVFFNLKKIYGIKKNVKIKIIKNLPIASGIGGGSSNAASFFRIIESLFNLFIKKAEKIKILNNFGSDVPFCYFQKPSIVRGIGEKIQPAASFHEFYILLINPLIQISTKEIFERKNRTYTNSPTNIKSGLNRKQFIEILSKSSNDLEKVVIKSFPQVKSIMDFLQNETNSIFSRMSGSGGTCFGLFNDLNDLELAFNKVDKTKKKWWFKKGKILNKIENIIY